MLWLFLFEVKLNKKIVNLVTCWNSSTASQYHFLLAVDYKRKYMREKELKSLWILIWSRKISSENLSLEHWLEQLLSTIAWSVITIPTFRFVSIWSRNGIQKCIYYLYHILATNFTFFYCILCSKINLSEKEFNIICFWSSFIFMSPRRVDRGASKQSNDQRWGKEVEHEAVFLDSRQTGWPASDSQAVWKGWQWLWNFIKSISFSLGRTILTLFPVDDTLSCFLMKLWV